MTDRRTSSFELIFHMEDKSNTHRKYPPVDLPHAKVGMMADLKCPCTRACRNHHNPPPGQNRTAAGFWRDCCIHGGCRGS